MKLDRSDNNRNMSTLSLDVVITAYPKGSAVIRYKIDEKILDWVIGACEKDNKETLKARLNKYLPKAEFIDFRIK